MEYEEIIEETNIEGFDVNRILDTGFDVETAIKKMLER